MATLLNPAPIIICPFFTSFSVTNASKVTGHFFRRRGADTNEPCIKGVIRSDGTYWNANTMLGHSIWMEDAIASIESSKVERKVMEL